MYQIKHRVGYSEIDEKSEMKLSAVMDCFQNSCIFQSEDAGTGVQVLAEREEAWLLASWQIVVNRYPKLCEKVIITTMPYDFKGFYGFRNFVMEDEVGEVLAYANSNWFYMDTKTGRPKKVPMDVVESYGGLDEPYPMECAPRKLDAITDGEQLEPLEIPAYLIDTNHHVNNAKYVMVAEGYLPENYRVQEVRVEYKQAARLGDVFYPLRKQEGNKVSVALNNAKGVPYVVIEFFGGEND